MIKPVEKTRSVKKKRQREFYLYMYYTTVMNGKINGIYFNLICHDFGYTFSDTFPHLYPDRLMLRENMIPVYRSYFDGLSVLLVMGAI